MYVCIRQLLLKSSEDVFDAAVVWLSGYIPATFIYTKWFYWYFS